MFFNSALARNCIWPWRVNYGRYSALKEFKTSFHSCTNSHKGRKVKWDTQLNTINPAVINSARHSCKLWLEHCYHTLEAGGSATRYIPAGQLHTLLCELWKWWRHILCSGPSWDPSWDAGPRSHHTFQTMGSTHPHTTPLESCHRIPAISPQYVRYYFWISYLNSLDPVKGHKQPLLKLHYNTKQLFTSHPGPGGGPSQFGGGPPYFRWPVVTSRV